MIVEDSVVRALASRTLTLLRAQPSTLPDPAAEPVVKSAPSTRTGGVDFSSWHRAASYLVGVRATVYDKRRTFLQWQDPESRVEHEAWSNIDFNHLSSVSDVESVDRRWILFLVIVNIDTSVVNPATGQAVTEPTHPPIPEDDGPKFVVTKGDTTDPRSTAPLHALHKLYAEKSDELIAAAEVQKQTREQMAQEEADQSQPRDNVMWFRPKKGSRYLQQEGGGR
ncbi:hypothetical protein [Luteolibacter luteus]|uniref:Uncharacterized protein n=1 Tax=Luteolibacter luteus TaxID=2728835 RepID=A0A858RL45_9BACT|nr:hypothetical protein [Luteolibacter luteus]QJE97321.1 hypothetical protein HHL09_16505 [Luteolibacter luteus]